MRVVILGGTGMLGSDLVASAPRGVSIVAPDPEDVDITVRSRVAATLDDAGPDWVINAAAYTAVDLAESQTELATAVNGAAPGLLGQECARRRISVAHFGTDYVFPGTASTPYRESDPVAPVNAYGLSKLEGERALLSSGAHALILRTQWLFGLAGKSFPRTMWERASAAKPTRVVNDQYGRPTYTKDLAVATWELIALRASGILHVTNGGDPVTWFDVAQRVFARAGSESMLAPCGSADYPTPAKRPTYSALNTERVESVLHRVLPPWRDALDRFLDELTISATNVDGNLPQR
jgi:dTDP-4-dehydrorhamnose reductase